MIFCAKHDLPHSSFSVNTRWNLFLLAFAPGVENTAAEYLSSLYIRFELRIHLKLSDSIPVCHVESDITSKTPKQEEDVMDYYPYDEVVENIRKHRSSTLDDEPSGNTQQEHTTPPNIP